MDERFTTSMPLVGVQSSIATLFLDFFQVTPTTEVAAERQVTEVWLGHRFPGRNHVIVGNYDPDFLGHRDVEEEILIGGAIRMLSSGLPTEFDRPAGLVRRLSATVEDAVAARDNWPEGRASMDGRPVAFRYWTFGGNAVGYCPPTARFPFVVLACPESGLSDVRLVSVVDPAGYGVSPAEGMRRADMKPVVQPPRTLHADYLRLFDDDR